MFKILGEVGLIACLPYYKNNFHANFHHLHEDYACDCHQQSNATHNPCMHLANPLSTPIVVTPIVIHIAKPSPVEMWLFHDMTIQHEATMTPTHVILVTSC